MERRAAYWRRVSSAAFVFLGFLAPLAGHAEERLPAKERLTILLTVLSYDTAIDRFQASGLRIGVVGRTDSPQSAQDAKEMLDNLRGVSSKTVKSLSIQGFPVNLSSASELSAAIDAQQLNVLYLSAGLGGMREALVAEASRRGLLLLAGESDAVRGGAAIGAVSEDAKPKIVVNLKAATGQGARLDARILRLAKVIQ